MNSGIFLLPYRIQNLCDADSFIEYRYENSGMAWKRRVIGFVFSEMNRIWSIGNMNHMFKIKDDILYVGSDVMNENHCAFKAYFPSMRFEGISDKYVYGSSWKLNDEDFINLIISELNRNLAAYERNRDYETELFMTVPVDFPGTVESENISKFDEYFSHETGSNGENIWKIKE